MRRNMHVDSDRPERPFALMVARWLLFPVCFVAGVWLFALYPQEVTDRTPDLFCGLWQTTHKDGLSPLEAVLPPVPSSMSQSFKLGKVYQSLSTVQEGSAAQQKLLLEAGALFGRSEPLSAKQMEGLLQAIIDRESEVGVVSRVMGFFTFVNILWLVAIVGLTATFYPFIALIAAPIARILTEFYREYVVAFFKAIKPVYEPLAYLLCFMFLVQGGRYHPEVGFFISLTGLIGFVPTFLYSTNLHTTPTGKVDAFAQLFGILCMAVWMPSAVHYQSTLIGFMSTFALYQTLGFSVACYGLCWLIGFDDKKALERVVLTSVLLVTFFVLAKIYLLYSLANVGYLLKPFSTAVLTLGNVTYFLGLLILASRFNSESDFTRFNFLMVFSLALVLFFGTVWSMAPLVNTACTFGVMFAMEKVAEQRFWYMGGNFIALAFLSFAALYFLSLFLSTHPGYIVAMVDSSVLL